MAVSARNIVLCALTLTVLSAALVPLAFAQEAKSDRCEGTLCDLYYSGKGEPEKTGATQSAAPTMLTTATLPAGAKALTAPSSASGFFGFLKPSSSGGSVPTSEPEAATNSYMHLGTGGLLGSGNERCSGSLCDLYYHGSPTSESSGSQQVSAAGFTAAPAEAPVPHRHIVHESETRPKCSSPNADPWRCYR